jgi:predicted Na+-dependent transporter
VFLPVAAWLLGLLVPWPDLRVGLLLSASVPCTLASAVLWTRLAAGNDATALMVAVATTFLSWAATTFWLVTLTGASVDLDATRLMLDLVVTLILPVGAGQGLRLLAPFRTFANRRYKELGTLAQLLVLSIIVKTAAEVGTQARAETSTLSAPFIATSAALTLGLHLAALFTGLWSSRVLGIDRPRQIAVAISCSQKTLPLALYLFHSYYRAQFPLAVAALLFFHVGQLLLDTFIARRLAAGIPKK